MEENRSKRAGGDPGGAARSQDGDPDLRSDVNDGLRHLSVMGMQTRYDLLEASAQVHALAEELMARGHIDQGSYEARVQRFRQQEQERMRHLTTVQVGDRVDKYALPALPEIDCPSLMPLCKARCCSLHFPLTFQDLDEGVVKFDYGRPYLIRKHPGSAYCCHNDPGTRACTVYAQRPAVCRQYDCRTDRRIWLDFERRIPAPDQAPGAPPAAMPGPGR